MPVNVKCTPDNVLGMPDNVIVLITRSLYLQLLTY